MEKPCLKYKQDEPCPNSLYGETPRECTQKCYEFAQWEQEKLLEAIASIREGRGKISTEYYEYVLEDLANASSERDIDTTAMYNDLYVHPDGWAVPMPLIAKVNLPLAKWAYTHLEIERVESTT